MVGRNTLQLTRFRLTVLARLMKLKECVAKGALRIEGGPDQSGVSCGSERAQRWLGSFGARASVSRGIAIQQRPPRWFAGSLDCAFV